MCGTLQDWTGVSRTSRQERLFPTLQSPAVSHSSGAGWREIFRNAQFPADRAEIGRTLHEFVPGACHGVMEKPPGRGTGVERMAGRPALRLAATEFRQGSDASSSCNIVRHHMFSGRPFRRSARAQIALSLDALRDMPSDPPHTHAGNHDRSWSGSGTRTAP